MATQLHSPTVIYDREDASKPYMELLGGIAVRKEMPTELHGFLVAVLTILLEQLNLNTGTEIRLLIDPEWEPIPDLIALTREGAGPYPTEPVAVAVEVLSPADRFSQVHAKCERYSDWGVQDILVFEPAARFAWTFSKAGMMKIVDRYEFISVNATLELAKVWEALDRKLTRLKR